MALKVNSFGAAGLSPCRALLTYLNQYSFIISRSLIGEG
jgi:hypothetical protein